MIEYTIQENVTLPSLGKIYEYDVPADLTLRAMTTNEEQLRLAPGSNPYKNLANVIDACIVSDFPMSSYDLCIGDFQFLIYKLRTITYGSDYSIRTTCPICGHNNDETFSLDLLEPIVYSDEILEKYQTFKLPVTEKEITLKFQTPRMLDDNQKEANEMRVKNPELNLELTLSLASIIDKIDGKKPRPQDLEKFVRNLNMKDTNTILQYADKLNSSIGVNTDLNEVCNFCTMPYKTYLKITPEFFRPALII